MGLLDQLGGSLKSVLASAAAGEQSTLISALLAKTNLGDLQGLVNQLQQGGLGDQVKSWLGNGANMKVTNFEAANAFVKREYRAPYAL